MRNKTAAGLFALFLGGIGVHKFYLGKVGQGILYLLFCWTFIPAIVAFVEAILLLTMADAVFNAKYNADQAADYNMATPKSHVKCPECRELVFKDASKCKHCGTVLVPQ